jgi:hypothetical protein
LLNAIQRRTRGETRPSGVAGVPVDLRMNEHDVKRQLPLTSPRWSIM